MTRPAAWSRRSAKGISKRSAHCLAPAFGPGGPHSKQEHQIVLAYHIIFTAYGFWLPNDPRGSWSDFVWAWELRRFGPATKVTTRRSLAAKPHDRTIRMAAKRSLLRHPVQFDGTQARAIAQGFDDARRSGDYGILACSILPTHAHAVIRRHATRSIETIANHLKAGATTHLLQQNLHPFQNDLDKNGRHPTPWTESFWQVYLDSASDIRRAERYVHDNPIKEYLPKQNWWFLENNRTLARIVPAQRPGLNYAHA